MADHQAHVSSTSSVFAFPRFTNYGFKKRGLEIETVTSSPTSILDTKKFFPNNDHKSLPKTPRKGDRETGNQERIGLALIDSLNEKDDDISHSVTRKVLKIQIPQIETNFGTKTRIAPLSKPPFRNSGFNSPKIFNISATDMELSEDYTRIITHGPSPRTTHIYDDCVLECCVGVVGLSELKTELPLSPSVKSNLAIESFLSFCCSCKKKLDHGKDIYIYRGKKVFAALNAATNRCSPMKKTLKLSPFTFSSRRMNQI